LQGLKRPERGDD